MAIGISLSVDPLGAGMAAFAAVMVLAALTYSVRYFDAVGGCSTASCSFSSRRCAHVSWPNAELGRIEPLDVLYALLAIAVAVAAASSDSSGDR